jgi:hypothetical protein
MPAAWRGAVDLSMGIGADELRSHNAYQRRYYEQEPDAFMPPPPRQTRARRWSTRAL